MSLEQLNWKAEPTRWSAGQIYAHMMLANAQYLPLLKIAIDGAPRARVGDSVQHTWFGQFIIKGAGPEGNAPAPKSLHPRSTPFDKDVVEQWAAQTQDFMDLARRAHGADLCAAKIKNPFIPLLKLNLADCFEILTEHTERHIRQIEALAERAGNAAQP